MADIADGEVVYVQGSGKEPYELKNVGGVYSCSCPAWRNAGGAIDRRTCKHLKALRGVDAEAARLGASAADLGATKVKAAPKPKKPAGEGGADDADDADDAEAAEGKAPPVLLAHKWEGEDLTGWWLSEKLDGVRAWWDGERFVSRLGNAFIAPDWFTASLPKHPLDGELWVARQKFQDCVSIVRRQDAGDAWKQVKYLVFDAPHLDLPFEGRVEYINTLFSTHHPFAEAHTHVRCDGVDHLREELKRVEALGGEGLMLRRPGSKYEAGRSSTLLKVKTFHDAEGRVVGHEDGKGKHKGRLGALVVEMDNGTRFNVGTGFTDKERESPPPIGSVITYRYQELTPDGVPRFPTYVGPAIDKAAPTAASSAPLPATKPSSSPAKSSSSSPSSAPVAGGLLPSSLAMPWRFAKDGVVWAIDVQGPVHTVRRGPAETPGAPTERRFDSPAAALADALRRVADQLEAGFRPL
jgi:DNA ligase-1